MPIAEQALQDRPCYSFGLLRGHRVAVLYTLDGQDILIEHGDTGQRLAALLANGQAQLVQTDDDVYWRVPHDQETDRLLVELIDLFISIRYAHPTLVQLELHLDEVGT
ncbi:MAG: hypothetical protein JXA93_06420 [Anaerolineae bacterium]|nr:hypothetical protein [Anaerolineae bacterium]